MKFGALPEGNLFFDQPEENPFPEEMTGKILDVPLGQMLWVGPISGADIYGFENATTPQSIMIAAWKSVDVSYGDCYALMLMDESVFEAQFSSLRDGKSTWHLFAEDLAEIYHTGEDECLDPDRLISESNSGTIIRNENGLPVCTFSMTLKSPAWTLVREVSMKDYEQVVFRVRRAVAVIAGVVFLIALAIYWLWLKRFMRQFDSLLTGVIRMGEGDLESTGFVPTSIDEFQRMQQEINRTRLALVHQMDTIRQMEREQKEKEIISRELGMAREIQKGALPHVFPLFPERKEIELFASMDPARDVGGDFYDFFFIDEEHLCLVIADVSGKGVPAALFMMVAKRILEDSARLEHSVSEILKKTNRSLCDSNQAEMFVTVWMGILDLTTGKLTAANAGHEYPMVYTKGEDFKLYKDKHGFVIGGMQGVHYVEYNIQLNPGDKIFVYTDGVPEATSSHGEMFGTERLLTALNTSGEGSPEEILREVRKAVDAFVGEAEQFDDLTMLCLEFKQSSQATNTA